MLRPLHVKNNLADDALFVPMKIDFAAQLVGNHALHHARAKTSMRRRLYTRAAGFNPLKA